MPAKVRSGRTPIYAAAVVLLQILGCRDSLVSSEQSAAISVSVKVAGVFPSKSFRIQVDGRTMTLPINEGSLVVRGLADGTHTVAIVELPANCQSDGANPVTLETSAANLSRLEFRVSCVATTGAIAIAVSVARYNKPLWLSFQVDSSYFGTVKGNATTVLDRSFSGGVHVVRLFDVPSFCKVNGEISTPVSVKTGAVTQDTAVASIDLDCDPPQLGADTLASIAFERDGYIMVLRESGGSPVAVTDGKSPAWSPDGKLIAFQRRSCDPYGTCQHDLWLTSADGNIQRPVIEAEFFDDYDAAFSPDALRLAFLRFALGPDQTYLAVSDLNGGPLKFLSIWSAVSAPSWSPDGAQIVFVCVGVPYQENSDLCLANTDKSCDYYVPSRCDLPELHLTTGPGDDWDPAWSHDGHRIAFTLSCSERGACPPGITTADPYVAIIDVTTKTQTRLVPGHDPAWSPDGSQLVFTGNTSSPGLWAYTFADGSVRQLTNNPRDRAPSWRQ